MEDIGDYYFFYVGLIIAHITLLVFLYSFIVFKFFLEISLENLLVSYGNGKKMLRAWWLKMTQISPLTVLEVISNHFH